MNTQYESSVSYHRIDRRPSRIYHDAGMHHRLARTQAVSHRNERVRVQQIQRNGALAFLAVILLIFGMILGSTFLSSSRSNAASNEPVLYKYYTSIQVQPGDTLWSIAQEYAPASEISQQDYVDEVIRMNHLQGETIHAGDYLTVSYYSGDFK